MGAPPAGVKHLDIAFAVSGGRLPRDHSLSLWQAPVPAPPVRVQVLVAIHAVTLTPAGDVLLELVGEPGQTYEVQASSDLNDWLGLGPLTAGPDGHMAFAEPPPPGAEVRFYRVVRR